MKRATFFLFSALPSIAFAQSEHGETGQHAITEELKSGHHYECISQSDPTHAFTVHQKPGEQAGTYAMNGDEKEVMVVSGLSTVTYLYLADDSSINLTVHLDDNKFEVSYGGALFGEEHGTCTILDD